MNKSREVKISIAISISFLCMIIFIIGFNVGKDSESTVSRKFSVDTVETNINVSPNAEGNIGCGVATVSPDPEPCLAVQGSIRYAFFGNIVNSTQFKKWKEANPGEFARVTEYMKSGSTSPPSMLTPLGGTLVAAIQAYWYARGTTAITWPSENPTLDPKRKDKKAPSSPSGIKINP